MKTPNPTLIAAAAWLLCVGITHASETNSGVRACCRRSLPSTIFTDKSLYQVESTWKTDAGNEIKLGSLKGRPQVVLMFFSHCTTACPILVNDLRRIEAALTPDARSRVGFTLVSFDSERDTPTALAEYRKEWKLPASWTLLHGKPDDVSELAALLGVQYRQSTDGQFAHSNVITLLDANGEISLQPAGLDATPQAIAERIEQILK
jgi:protein SCO1/2